MGVGKIGIGKKAVYEMGVGVMETPCWIDGESPIDNKISWACALDEVDIPTVKRYA